MIFSPCKPDIPLIFITLMFGMELKNVFKNIPQKVEASRSILQNCAWFYFLFEGMPQGYLASSLLWYLSIYCNIFLFNFSPLAKEKYFLRVGFMLFSHNFLLAITHWFVDESYFSIWNALFLKLSQSKGIKDKSPRRYFSCMWFVQTNITSNT